MNDLLTDLILLALIVVSIATGPLLWWLRCLALRAVLRRIDQHTRAAAGK